MLHDPFCYPNPFKFDPTRFLGPNPQKDPRDICFGFGRRICPGRVLADGSLFIICAQTLAAFFIGKAVENGFVVEPVYEQTKGTIRLVSPLLFHSSTTHVIPCPSPPSSTL